MAPPTSPKYGPLQFQAPPTATPIAPAPSAFVTTRPSSTLPPPVDAYEVASKSGSPSGYFTAADAAAQDDLAAMSQLSQEIAAFNGPSDLLDAVLDQYVSVQNNLSNDINNESHYANGTDGGTGARDDVELAMGNIAAGQQIDAEVGNSIRSLNGTPHADGPQLANPAPGIASSTEEYKDYGLIYENDQILQGYGSMLGTAAISQQDVDAGGPVVNAMADVDAAQAGLTADESAGASETDQGQDESNLSTALVEAQSALNNSGTHKNDDSAEQAVLKNWARTPFVPEGTTAGPQGNADYTQANDHGTNIPYQAPPAVNPPSAYGSPPSSQYMGSLSQQQDQFLGWACVQVQAGKQVTVPAADAPTWNWLIANQLQTNNMIGQDYSDFPWSPDNSVGGMSGQVGHQRQVYEHDASGGSLDPNHVIADTWIDDHPYKYRKSCDSGP